MTEASTPHPPQRRVAGRVHTPAGWIAGTFHVPEQQSLLSFFNSARDFFTLTEVQLPGQSSEVPFLALQRSAVNLIIPAADERIDDDAAPDEDAVTHHVSCLLDGGVLMGTLQLPASVRVSDHLMANARFLAIHNCTVGFDRPRGV